VAGRLLTVGAVLLALATVSYGVLSVLSVAAIRTYRTTTSFPLTNHLVLRGGDAEITLVADATDEIVVESEIRRGLGGASAGARLDGDDLVLDGGCDGFPSSFCSIRLTVHVPERLDLEGRITDGSLTAAGLVGTIDLRVADGRLDLTGMQADTVALSVQDGSADLRLVNAPRSISVRTADGRATICVPESAPAYSVTTRQSDGRVRVEIPDDPRSDRPADLSTVDGTVTARFCP